MPHRRRSLPARAVTAALAAATVGMVSVAAAAAYHEPEAYFTLRDPEITESSGIAASARADDLFFTHNDSGDTARFFAVDDHGCTQAVFDLADRGTIAIDWEDMARGPKIDGKPTLFLADIGDNFAARPNVVVYRVVEPKVKRQPSPADPAAACPPARARTVAATTFELTYEDGPRDAEALLVDPRTGRLYVVTKVGSGDAALYAAPERLSRKRPNVLRNVAVGAGDHQRDVRRHRSRRQPAGAAHVRQRLRVRDPGRRRRGCVRERAPEDHAAEHAPRRGDRVPRDSGAWVTTSEGAGSVVYRLDDHP